MLEFLQAKGLHALALMGESGVVECGYEVHVLPHGNTRRSLVGLGFDQTQDRVDDFFRISSAGIERPRSSEG